MQFLDHMPLMPWLPSSKGKAADINHRHECYMRWIAYLLFVCLSTANFRTGLAVAFGVTLAVTITLCSMSVLWDPLASHVFMCEWCQWETEWVCVSVCARVCVCVCVRMRACMRACTSYVCVCLRVRIGARVFECAHVCVSLNACVRRVYLCGGYLTPWCMLGTRLQVAG